MWIDRRERGFYAGIVEIGLVSLSQMRTVTAHQPPTQTLETVLGSDPAVVRGFAKAADDKLARGHLNLADRDLLISRGQRLGLKRFDANLILATMEQRRRERPLRLAEDWESPNPSLPSWLKWSAVALTQSVIVVGALWLFV